MHTHICTHAPTHPHTHTHTDPPTPSITTPSNVPVIVASQDYVSSDEDQSPLVSLQSVPEGRQADSVIPLQVNVQSDSRNVSHDSESNLQPSNDSASIQTPSPIAIPSVLTFDPLANTDTEPAVRQHSEGAPVVSESPTYQRQLSHPETRLLMIRQTLHGRRHASFHTSRSHDMSHDFARSMEVLSEATPATPSRVSDLTETLPPSK